MHPCGLAGGDGIGSICRFGAVRDELTSALSTRHPTHTPAQVPLASQAVAPAVKRVPINQRGGKQQQQGKTSTPVDLPSISVGLFVALGCVVATLAASRVTHQPQDGEIAQELTPDELELLTATLATCERLVGEVEELAATLPPPVRPAMEDGGSGGGGDRGSSTQHTRPPGEVSSPRKGQSAAYEPSSDSAGMDRRVLLRSELQETIERLSALEGFAGSKAKLTSLSLKRALAALNEMDSHGSELTGTSASDVLSIPLALTVSAAEETLYVAASATIAGGGGDHTSLTSVAAAVAEGGVTAGPLDRVLVVATAASAAAAGGQDGQEGQESSVARLTLHVNEIRAAIRTVQSGVGSFDYDESRLPNLLVTLNDGMVRDAASRSRDMEQLCSKSKSDVKNAHRDADKKLGRCQQAMQLKRAEHADKHRKRMAELAAKIKEQTQVRFGESVGWGFGNFMAWTKKLHTHPLTTCLRPTRLPACPRARHGCCFANLLPGR